MRALAILATGETRWVEVAGGERTIEVGVRFFLRPLREVLSEPLAGPCQSPIRCRREPSSPGSPPVFRERAAEA